MVDEVAPVATSAAAPPTAPVSPAPAAPSAAPAPAAAPAPVSTPVESAAAEPSTTAPPPATQAAQIPDASQAEAASPKEAASSIREHEPSLIEQALTKREEKTPAETPVAEPKPDEPTPEGLAPAEAPQPIAYEFKYPDGFDASTLNKETLEKYTGILGEAKVPPEKAQALLDMHLAEVQRIESSVSNKQWEVFSSQQEAWKNEIKNDPTIGGAHFNETMQTCAAVIEQYGGRDTKEILDGLKATGAGNNPALVRLFNNIGKALATEGRVVEAPGTPPKGLPPITGLAAGSEARAQRRYGNGAA